MELIKKNLRKPDIYKQIGENNKKSIHISKIEKMYLIDIRNKIIRWKI